MMFGLVHVRRKNKGELNKMMTRTKSTNTRGWLVSDEILVGMAVSVRPTQLTCLLQHVELLEMQQFGEPLFEI